MQISPLFSAVATPARHWVFGYGSLIWKVDFPTLERRRASLAGWRRRLWQGSHDHRGTPDAPGRVATLVADPQARCEGIAYLIEEAVFTHLDQREKNGYVRHEVELVLERDGCVPATMYLAPRDNPAFLGDATEVEIARHVFAAHGPSGSNREYVLRLAEALHALGIDDPHVSAVARLLRELDTAPTATGQMA